MWARYGVFLVTLTCLVAMVTMEIPKPMVSLEKMEENSNGIYTEKCWPDRSKCVNRSAQGSGLRWEKCWLRCKCRGYLRGWCSKTEECETTDNPYMCKCTGPTDSQYWLRLCYGLP